MILSFSSVISMFEVLTYFSAQPHLYIIKFISIFCCNIHVNTSNILSVFRHREKGNKFILSRLRWVSCLLPVGWSGQCDRIEYHLWLLNHQQIEKVLWGGGLGESEAWGSKFWQKRSGFPASHESLLACSGRWVWQETVMKGCVNNRNRKWSDVTLWS